MGNHWVCYEVRGSLYAAGPYDTCREAAEQCRDIEGYDGVGAAFVHAGEEPPAGYMNPSRTVVRQ